MFRKFNVLGPVLLGFCALMMGVIPASAAAQPVPTSLGFVAVSAGGGTSSSSNSSSSTQEKWKPCGAGKPQPDGNAYMPSINIGCRNQGNPIADALFAIIRILSQGVGLVVIASIIWGGITYASSQGDPQNTTKGLNRIKSSLAALLIYVFGYAILNYLIPAGFLK